MKKLIAIIVLLAVVSAGIIYRDTLFGNQENSQNNTKETSVKVPRGLPEKKEVKVFSLIKHKPALEFTKSGVSASETVANVSPQTGGKIVKINVKVGDNVKKGDILIELGESLSTDLADLQADTAGKTLNLTSKTSNLNTVSNVQTANNLTLSVNTAYNAYNNAMLTRENSMGLFDYQLETAEINVDSAKNAYEQADDAYDDAHDLKEDLEDKLEDLEDILPSDDPRIVELENSIEQAEKAEDSAEIALDNAENGLEQAKIALSQLEKNLDNQVDQLDYAVESAYKQYQSAVNQKNIALTGAQISEYGSDMQVLQADSGYKSAKLNTDYTKITSPIDGIVTSISAEEGNIINPGQIVAKIENNETISVKTSVNEQEARLISSNISVSVLGEFGETTGEIVSISPTANELTKKIDLEIEIEKDTLITAGSFVKVKFSLSPQNIIFIPLNSIQLEENKKIVKVIDEKYQVQKREIEIGQIVGNYVEVTSGLTGNEKIIKVVTTFIKEGDKVALTE